MRPGRSRRGPGSPSRPAPLDAPGLACRATPQRDDAATFRLPACYRLAAAAWPDSFGPDFPSADAIPSLLRLDGGDLSGRAEAVTDVLVRGRPSEISMPLRGVRIECATASPRSPAGP